MANVKLMPKLGMTMTAGKVVRWLKKEGEKVEAGEPLLEIETDKVTMEEEAGYTGTLLKILVREGEEVPINQPIAIIGGEGEDIEEILKTLKVSEGVEEEKKEEKIKVKIEEKPEEVKREEISKPRATPAARKMAREHGIDLSEVIGSGAHGRIHRKDVEEYIRKRTEIVPSQVTVEQKVEKKEEIPSYRVIPFTGMRKIIAEKMQKSINTAPHFYVTMEVKMREILKLRETLNSKLKEDEAKISLNTLLMKAAGIAIKDYPIFNSYVEEGQIILRNEINIGLAVALDEGLIVPVIREVDKKGLKEIAREEKALIQKAREGKLTPDEYTGGSFTISNLGMFDVVRFTAIINPPEVAILAVGKIREIPVVEEGQIEIEPIMEMTLSSDHRVIDGALAAKFLKRIKEILEDPLQFVL